MNELALFAGVGGGILGGTLLGWRTICAVEYDAYCRKTIFRRQRDGMLSLFPIWDDVRTFSCTDDVAGPFVEALRKVSPLIITGGFPCQPYSAAGKRRGSADKRNLWPDTIRIIREVEPEIVLLENVSGLLSFDYFGEILGGLAETGYDAEWRIVSAGSMDAPHVRKRLWILAWHRKKAVFTNTQSIRCMDGSSTRGLFNNIVTDSTRKSKKDTSRMGSGKEKEDTISNTDDIRCLGGKIKTRIRFNAEKRRSRTAMDDARKNEQKQILNDIAKCCTIGETYWKWWEYDPADVVSNKGKTIKESSNTISSSRITRQQERIRFQQMVESGSRRVWGLKSKLGRVDDGVADRLDRLRTIGNGQVAVVAAFAFVDLARQVGLDLERYCPIFRAINNKGNL
jgi:DNA (cytosine-5)-methyltransferase 1